MKRVFLVLFIAAAALEIVSLQFDMQNLRHFARPFLMIFLGGYYFVSVSSEHRSKLVLLALLLSFIGDSLMMYGAIDVKYLHWGLTLFMLAYGAYILAFREHRSVEYTDQVHGVQRIRMAFPIILAATGLMVVLYPRLGTLQMPAILYAIVVMVMVLNALFRYQRTPSESFWMVSGGAILLLVSNSLFAIDNFLEPIASAAVIVAIIYVCAQFLIIHGLLKHRI